MQSLVFITYFFPKLSNKNFRGGGGVGIGKGRVNDFYFIRIVRCVASLFDPYISSLHRQSA